MKALNFLEVKTLVSTLDAALVKAQLQDVYANERGLVLVFHLQGRTYYLIVDLFRNGPSVILFDTHCPWKKSSKPKPVTLFLKSNVVNQYLKSVRYVAEFGRVMILEFSGGERSAEVEIHLIPRQPNLIVRSKDATLVKGSEKTISWERPTPLQTIEHNQDVIDVRLYEQIHQDWVMANTKVGKDSSVASESTKPTITTPHDAWDKQRQKDLQKKRKALEEIKKSLDEDKILAFKSLGEILKEKFSYGEKSLKLEMLPAQYHSMIDVKLGLFGNMNRAFQKAKQLEEKREGTRVRQQIIESEILKLERATYSPKIEDAKLNLKKQDLLNKTESKGRRLQLEGGLVAYLGKSAQDNLAILRAARAWDVWFHLRDYPGAHAIVRRNKDQIIKPSDYEQVAKWVAKESGSLKQLLPGTRLAVVVVECRYVRPIKGDKAGKVTYTHGQFFEVET